MGRYKLMMDGELIMRTSYKPSIDDVIKDDETGSFYKVTEVNGFTCEVKYEVGYRW